MPRSWVKGKPLRILIDVQRSLEESYKYNPKLDVVEMVCYIGSAVSLWFGISLLTFSNERWIHRVKRPLTL